MAVTIDQLEIEISYTSKGAADAIDKLCKSLAKLQRRLGTLDFSKLTDEMAKVNNALGQISNKNIAKIVKLAEALKTLASVKVNLGKIIPNLQDVTEKAQKASKALKEVKEASKKARTVSGDVISGENAKKATEETTKWSVSLGKVKEGFKKLLSPVQKLVKAIGRIAFYRLIRTMLKSIVEGFTTGLSNAYQYSVITGFRLASTLDSISSSAYKMKNQLGSLAGEVISTLAPAIIRLTQIVTTAADALAQLFAALQGKGTYLKAKDISKPWEDAAKSTQKMKDNLQGFDKLNVISTPSSSGNTPDYASMFEEVEVSEKIKKIAEWLKDHLKEILALALAIGAAIAAWKIGRAFGVSLGVLAGLLATIAGLTLFIVSAFDAWKNGVTWLNTLGMILGAIVATLGLFVALLSIGVSLPIAAILSAVFASLLGILMVIVAIHDWISKGELTNAAFVLLEVGLALFSLLLPAVGIFAMIQVALIKVGQELNKLIAKYFPDLKASIDNLFKSVFAFFGQLITNLFGPLIDYIKSVAPEVKSAVSKIMTAVGLVWDKTKEICAKIGELIGTLLGLILSKVVALISKIMSKINTSLIQPIKNILLELSRWVGVVFGVIATQIGSVIGGAIKTVINQAFALVEDVFNFAIGAFNAVLNKVNKIPGVSITTIDYLSLPRLAKGGITNGATTAMIGEAGQEAVLPLENNTGWMDKLADRISQNITVQFEVEGDPNGLFKVVQKQANVYTRRTGSSAFA